MKIRPVGAELFHADRRTDMAEVIVAFRNFANAPKTGLWRRIFTALVAGTMIIVFRGVTLARGFWAHWKSFEISVNLEHTTRLHFTEYSNLHILRMRHYMQWRSEGLSWRPVPVTPMAACKSNYKFLNNKLLSFTDFSFYLAKYFANVLRAENFLLKFSFCAHFATSWAVMHWTVAPHVLLSPTPSCATDYARNHCSTKISVCGSPRRYVFVCWIPWRYIFFTP
jgi:hypothetical protein